MAPITRELSGKMIAFLRISAYWGSGAGAGVGGGFTEIVNDSWKDADEKGLSTQKTQYND